MSDFESQPPVPIGVSDNGVSIRTKLLRAQRQFALSRILIMSFSVAALVYLYEDARVREVERQALISAARRALPQLSPGEAASAEAMAAARGALEASLVLPDRPVETSGLILLACGLIVLGILVTWITSRLLVRKIDKIVLEPVGVLVEGAALLAKGQLREDVVLPTRDELGRLARSLNQLRVSLALAEMKYRSLFANTSNNMLLMDAVTLQINDVNRSFEELTGIKRKQLLQRKVLELFDEEQRALLETGIRKSIAQGQHSVSGIMLTTPTRLMVVLEVRITSIQVSVEKVLEMSFIDITEQYVKNQALSEIAFKDELTGLYNHRSFYQRLNEEIDHARNTAHPLTLLFVDLDNFKRCNDTYGHQVGDQLLRNVGNLVRDHIRQDRDAGFRYGGDEFAVLLPDARVNVAERIANQVREGFESIEQYGTSMSIGVAGWKPELDAEAFVKAADKALYAAKSAGKNTVRVSE